MDGKVIPVDFGGDVSKPIKEVVVWTDGTIFRLPRGQKYSSRWKKVLIKVYELEDEVNE